MALSGSLAGGKGDGEGAADRTLRAIALTDVAEGAILWADNHRFARDQINGAGGAKLSAESAACAASERDDRERVLASIVNHRCAFLRQAG